MKSFNKVCLQSDAEVSKDFQKYHINKKGKTEKCSRYTQQSTYFANSNSLQTPFSGTCDISEVTILAFPLIGFSLFTKEKAIIKEIKKN